MLKDPNAVLPFAVDWSAWLAAEGDTAALVEWIIPAGITEDPDHFQTLADGKATVWLSGGTSGETYSIVCRMTTVGGRVDDRTLQVRVRDR